MKKRVYVGAATRPVSLGAAIRVENPYNEENTDQYGSIAQSYDIMSREFFPNRATYPTLLGLHVLLDDPNDSLQQSEVEWGGLNTVAWEVVRAGVTTAVTAQSTGDFTLAGYMLRIRLNQTTADGNVVIRATGTFYDSVGRVQTAVAEQSLTLNTSSTTNLTLLRDKLGTPGYVGEFFRLNPLTLDTVAKLTNAANWKKRCAVQLCDGTTPIQDAFTYMSGDVLDESSYMDTPEGSAFYFWFFRTPDGRLIQCTQDLEWLDAAWMPSGTAGKEVAVDLTKIRQVRLVCRAGYIPYGQLEDYVGDDGLVRPEILYMGFREVTFDVGVELPDVQRIVVADIAHCRLDRTELASSTTTIVKRALVTAGGSTLNDLSDTTPHDGNTQSWVERLYSITWLVSTVNGTEVPLGMGEWLQTTPQQIAILHGRALDADDMPQMSVVVEPRYPKLTGSNYVEGYVRGGAAVTPSQQQGNKEFLKQLDFWLLDTTDNTGTTTHAMKLQRNNILRFAGGGWAPAVRISPEMAADAQEQLFYRNSSGTYVQYCAAGEYDAEVFVESVLRPYFKGSLKGWYSEADGRWPKLYKKSGSSYIEAHALLPWETTETKYTTGIGFSFGVYLLDHQKRADGEWEWNGILTDVTEWDGIDVSPYYLAPTAFSPGPATQITENGRTVLRNFFYLAHPQGGIGGADAAGILGSSMFNEPGRAYPKTLDISALTCASRARANNDVATRSYPFAEGGFHTLNTLITCQELLYSRRNLHDKNFFGSGISSNDAVNNEDSLWQNGGWKAKVNGASDYVYGRWSDRLPVKSAVGSTKNSSEDINNYQAKEQCMESQLAASFAVEFGIQETSDFELPWTFWMYGGKYYWLKPGNVESLADGYMNARVYRILEDTLTGYDDNGTQTTCEFVAHLRMSLMAGLNLSGDIYMYAQGGAEVIGECVNDPNESRVGNPVRAYLIPDQTRWKLDTAITKDNQDVFEIEHGSAAIITGGGENLADGYYAQRIGYSPLKAANGGGIGSYECCYGYTQNNWGETVGKKTRIALRFRGYSHNTNCSPRNWNANYSASNTNRYNGGSAQDEKEK